jgi:diguanylate cyclase (GGDEF)-like protein
MRGNMYQLIMLFIYLPLLVIAVKIFLYRNILKKNNVLITFAFIVIFIITAFVDLSNISARLIWPCITSILLFSWFYIIQSDTKIDSLTGLDNRYSFNEFSDKLLSHITGESWAIVMIDIDHFKEINHKLGHTEGDNALCDMAEIIKNCIRKSDFAARYGSDEFVIATRVENGIADLISNIKNAAKEHNKKNIRPYKLEICYGFDIFTANGSKTIETFLSNIDNLMYTQKEERRRAEDISGGPA